MNDALRLEIEAEALAAAPNECFGYIVQNYQTGALERVSCLNVAKEPTEHAIPAHSDTVLALSRGRPLSTYHSHPDALETPSEADLEACEETELPSYIFSPKTLGWYCMRPSCAEEVPYVGREFVFGLHDCYSLVADWYRRELKIILPHLPRRDEFWVDGKAFLMQDAYDVGFKSITDPSDFRVGDVLIFLVNSPAHIPNHLGVYVGCGRFLHHLGQRLSCQDSLSGSWFRRLHSRLRHQSLC